ncbi:thioredoxin domain-containing protein [Aminipila sp.]|uniref:thioredoxin domain-containing protein n=1 Tax=Aminipila sp. TaxID=2060095 RepID=UPI00289D20FE|nr:thioredoxin domain-containing protein [Aminipila sp.]
MPNNTIPNHLVNEKSPYLLQHAYNPVDWYPWCDEAFRKAREEDKPIFMSIGYSTCHWCHVMAHESFEDHQVAEILNKDFISIKVDKEERPDIDSIYMSVCQAFTGSGGWPTSIFMTAEQKPFFAGTYFPKESNYGMIGFIDLLHTILENWKVNRQQLINSSEEIVKRLNASARGKGKPDSQLIEQAVGLFERSFDKNYGGFGRAPKFPTPHNLLFLMNYYQLTENRTAMTMVEKTLIQMYKGGIFDHIGYGFSRYSTDDYFLVPHFEKMLYDNALLMMSYTRAFDLTEKTIYKEIAAKTADYILREMTSEEGGFYCAQDADSEGIEGKYYVFEHDETVKLLGKTVGKAFNEFYGITKEGNFEGKNILNRLNNPELDDRFNEYIPQLYQYRKSRMQLHLDDKILTSWNSLMIAAFAMMFHVFNEPKYLEAAKTADNFITKNLMENNTLFVSFREGARSSKGFLDDYAFYIFALIQLYEATLDNSYLHRAVNICHKTLKDFHDKETGGFYLYGRENQQLIIIPKETYDGAIPSGNSVMAYNLVKLANITKDTIFTEEAKNQLEFMSSPAKEYPAGYSFFLMALSMYLNPAEDIVCVLKDKSDLDKLKGKTGLNTNVRILEKPTDEYKLINEKTTFYVCKNHSCLPPTNNILEVLQ